MKKFISILCLIVFIITTSPPNAEAYDVEYKNIEMVKIVDNSAELNMQIIVVSDFNFGFLVFHSPFDIPRKTHNIKTDFRNIIFRNYNSKINTEKPIKHQTFFYNKIFYNNKLKLKGNGCGGNPVL